MVSEIIFSTGKLSACSESIFTVPHSAGDCSKGDWLVIVNWPSFLNSNLTSVIFCGKPFVCNDFDGLSDWLDVPDPDDFDFFFLDWAILHSYSCSSTVCADDGLLLAVSLSVALVDEEFRIFCSSTWGFFFRFFAGFLLAVALRSSSSTVFSDVSSTINGWLVVVSDTFGISSDGVDNSDPTRSRVDRLCFLFGFFHESVLVSALVVCSSDCWGSFSERGVDVCSRFVWFLKSSVDDERISTGRGGRGTVDSSLLFFGLGGRFFACDVPVGIDGDALWCLDLTGGDDGVVLR